MLVLWVGEEEQSLWIFNTVIASFVILILFEPIKRFVEDTTENYSFANNTNFDSWLRD